MTIKHLIPLPKLEELLALPPDASIKDIGMSKRYPNTVEVIVEVSSRAQEDCD